MHGRRQAICSKITFPVSPLNSNMTLYLLHISIGHTWWANWRDIPKCSSFVSELVLVEGVRGANSQIKLRGSLESYCFTNIDVPTRYMQCKMGQGLNPQCIFVLKLRIKLNHMFHGLIIFVGSSTLARNKVISFCISGCKHHSTSRFCKIELNLKSIS